MATYECSKCGMAVNDIDHTKTKVKSPQTNGICERFHKTIFQEFYQVTLILSIFLLKKGQMLM